MRIAIHRSPARARELVGALLCITACAIPAARVEAPATPDARARAQPGAPAHVAVAHAPTEDAGVARAGEAADATPEASVHPGINDSYFEQATIRPWRRRFEREGREVFDHRHAIVEALALQPGVAVADIGAGTGLFTMLLAKAVGPAGRVFAVDLMPHFLAHIRAQAAAQGVAEVVTTVQATERSPSLAAGSVDVVFTSDAYHHIEYPRAYLAEIHAALRPGGLLYLIDYDRVEGESAAWLLEHVRAGEREVVGELEAAGFALEGPVALRAGTLRENYFLRFRRTP